METILLKNITISGKGEYGIAASSCAYNPDYPQYIRITDITDDGRYMPSPCVSINPSEYPNFNDYFLQEGDIVFARTGASTGRNYCYNPKDGDLVFAGFLIKFSIDSKKILPQYVKYYCQTQKYYDWVAGASTGSTRGNLNAQDFANMEIPVKSTEEQRHIVDILGSLDNKIENNEQLSIELQNYCIKKFDVMFSDTELCPLSDIAKITMGQSPDGNSYNESGNGMIFFQGRTDFGFRHPSIRLYTTEPKRTAKKGDILLSVRAPVGDINMAFDDCCIGRGLAAITSEVNAFIYYALLAKKSDFDVYNNAGTIFGSINKEALAKFNIPYQEETVKNFLSFAQPINDKIFELAQETLKLNEMKQLYLKKFFD